MPQLIENLNTKIVTDIAVGLDFAIALGQDFDEWGNPAPIISSSPDNIAYSS